MLFVMNSPKTLINAYVDWILHRQCHKHRGHKFSGCSGKQQIHWSLIGSLQLTLKRTGASDKQQDRP